MITIPYIPLVVGAVASFVLGMLWYMPFLFGSMWAKESGYTEQQMRDMHANLSTAHIIGFITYLVTGYVIWWLLHQLNIQTMQDALHLGFWLWLAFPAAQGFMSTQYSGKKMTVFLIDAGYQLVYILALCAIMFYFK